MNKLLLIIFLAFTVQAADIVPVASGDNITATKMNEVLSGVNTLNKFKGFSSIIVGLSIPPRWLGKNFINI